MPVESITYLLASAMEVAIARGKLPPQARHWKTVAALEGLADALGEPRTRLRNLFYQAPGRLAEHLSAYIRADETGMINSLSLWRWEGHSGIVWQRDLPRMLEDAARLPAAVGLLKENQAYLRAHPEVSPDFRRAVGDVAVEVLAQALSFLDGQKRARLMRTADAAFVAAMAPRMFDLEFSKADAAVISRFWENRATICGFVWHRIWDNPTAPCPVTADAVDMAIGELNKSIAMELHARNGDSGARLRQLEVDKAKWLIKIGRFVDANEQFDRIAALFGSESVVIERSFVRTLEAAHARDFPLARRLAGQLVELTDHFEGEGSHRHTSASMLLHNIGLLEGRTPTLPDVVAKSLQSSPVVVSEFVDFSSYVGRLQEAGYSVASSADSETRTLEPLL